MNEGRIEQQGTPDDVYSNPASAFVFDFLGRSNQIFGEVADGLFRAPALPAGLATDCAPGPAALFARPHDIALTHSGNGLRAKVTAVHRLAGRVSLDVTIEGQARGLLVDVPSNGGSKSPARGDIVELELHHYGIFPAPATR